MSIINLLPEDYLIRRSQRRANVMCLVLFAIIMTGVVGTVLVSERTTRHNREVRDRVNAAYVEAAKMLTQMQDLESRKARMLQKAQITAALLEKVPRSYLLAAVTNALPEGASLVELRLERKKVTRGTDAAKKKPRFAGAEVRSADPPAVLLLDVTGLAATDGDVARFIANMARNPLSGAVDLAYSQEKVFQDTKVREFQVKVELKNDADAIDALKPAGPETSSKRSSNAATEKPSASAAALAALKTGEGS